MHYWLLKTEPNDYSIADMERDHTVAWDGVRNYQARNNMKLMQPGDQAFFYASGKNPSIVGIVKVIKPHYPDPTDSRFVLVDVEFIKKLKNPVALTVIKSMPELSGLPMLRQSRLSVMPVTKEQWQIICGL